MIPILTTPVALIVQAQPKPPAPPLAFPGSVLWNPETRGPLLIILPGDEKSLQPVNFGSLTGFAPKQRTELLWEKLPTPDLYSSLADPEKFGILQASLSEQQWEKLCSHAGLGLTDLGRDQRTLFLALLPAPLTLSRGAEVVQIKDPERPRARLRLSRKFTYHFTNSSGASLALGSRETEVPRWTLGQPAMRLPVYRGFTESLPNEQSFIVSEVQSVAQTELPFITRLTDIQGVTLSDGLSQRVQFLSNGSSSGSSFGAKFTEPHNNSAKLGQLDFAAAVLDARVSLLGVPTVGELVTRCAEATKLELFCDPRYARRPLHLRGTSARAGDISQALARCLTGTWRKVGPGFVLTDDLVPLAIRMGHIHDWLSAAQAQLDQAREGTGATDALQSTYLRWSDDDPNRPDAALAERLARQEKDGQPGPLSVRMSELSPTVRAQVDKQIAAFQNNNNGDPNRAPLNTEKILYSPQTELELLVPGYDPIPVRWLGAGFRSRTMSELPVPPKVSPPRTLAVAIQSESEAQLAVTTAKNQGFTALWVQVGLDDAGLLAATVAAGKAEGLPVHALVRPLRAPMGTETTVETKRSPIYLRPDALESQAAVLPRLKALAATPGLAGLVLTDLYPTGYQRDGANWKELLGYSENLRLACLRQQGADPVDLTDAQLSSDPFRFPSQTVSFISFSRVSTPISEWYGPSRGLWEPFYRVRQDAADAFADSLLAWLKTSSPSILLTRLSRDTRSFSPTQRRLSVPTSSQPNSLGHFLAQWHEVTREKKLPESIVFDASDRSLSEALAVLNKLPLP